ncbi:hypothetical protein CAGA_24590 [Caproiciproducens galactitolivorans]|uniref:Uncharacterized protein n=1 Tax=Caproiciproducens galactitolivorans TaxID=642589 RepID=A0A4Z0Y7S9_9FIRM|nr:hypothetical protein CAGA_24590 [Caproiciproducens galactitolivorans]
MKLTISTSDRRFSISGTEEQLKALFCKLVSNIIFDKTVTISQQISVADTQSALAVKNQSFGVKGFLFVRCPKCGHEYGFCSKSPITEAICKECGEKFLLTSKMTPVEFTCECGHSFKYLTNISDSEFDIPCLDCGTPNAVIFHKADNQYKDVRRIHNA